LSTLKYPEWLKLNRERLSVDEYARYEQQYRYCLQIIRLFDDNDDGGGGGGEETAGAGRALQITELMQQMQDCGAPPQEILQQLAPGLELGTDGLPHLPTSAVSAGDCPVQ
jgi:peroxin-19